MSYVQAVNSRGRDQNLRANVTAELFRKGVSDHDSFLTSRRLPVLQQSIDSLRLALESAEQAVADRDTRGRCLNALGVALFDRHRFISETGDGNGDGAVDGVDESPVHERTDDLVAALRYLLAAYDKAEPGTVHRARVLYNLSSALNASLALAGPPLPPDLRDRLPSVRELREEMSSEPGVAAVERLRSAYESGYAAVAESGPAEGYPHLARAVEVLPRAAWGAHEQVLEFLAEHSGLATDAAACAIAANRADDAVRLLDHGRAVMWQQHLATRTRQEQLQRTGSRKTERLVHRMTQVHAGLSELDPLTVGKHANTAVPTPGNDVRMDTDRRGIAWPRNGVGTDMVDWSPSRLEDEWERLSRQAGAVLPGVSFTMQTYSDLRSAAADGPVVYLVVSPLGCDALIVTKYEDDPTRVPLPQLGAADAEERAKRYLTAMTGTHSNREEVIRDTLDWLWHAVVGPVLRVLPPSNASPNRMWWVPTGPLTTLPLHAAAPTDASDDGVSALDGTISSYTSTMHALILARDASRRGHGHLLVAADSDSLPGAGRFHAHLEQVVSRRHRTALLDADATHAKVSEALPKHAWTHFNCHAVQDLREPLKSHLVLHDKPLTVSDLADLPIARAKFAVLAACTTAAGGELVRDEWISLTAALYPGFQSVIGTLWPVPDGPTARITQSVYESLSRVPRRRPLSWLLRPALSNSNGADALRLAVLAERAERPDHPSAWVSFVHYGV